MAQLEAERDDRRRLVVDESVSDDLRVCREHIDDFPGLGFCEEGNVDFCEVFREDNVGVLSLDGAQSDVRVLDVRSAGGSVSVSAAAESAIHSPGVTLERGHSFNVELVVVDSRRLSARSSTFT